MILDEKIGLEWREELDLLYSKIVLKPAYFAESQLKEEPKSEESKNQAAQQPVAGPKEASTNSSANDSSRSSQEEEEPELDLLQDDYIAMNSSMVSGKVTPLHL